MSKVQSQVNNYAWLYATHDHISTAVTDQLVLIAATTDPEVQLQRARVVSELAAALEVLARPLLMAATRRSFDPTDAISRLSRYQYDGSDRRQNPALR